MEKSFPIITPYEVNKTDINGLFKITMKQVEDSRGTVREAFRQSAYKEAGIDSNVQWKQANVTETIRGAIRGMHAEAMMKLVSVIWGEAFGAYIDLRPDSPTRGNLVTVELKKGVQVIVPKGVANGFQSLTEGCQYLYFFDDEWRAGMQGFAVNPLDPEVNIKWPIKVKKTDSHLISEKDANAPSLKETLSLTKKAA